ncbi:hypothetical protein IAT38_005525 [Cryptococcus sp. DSM 104549]
MPPHAAAPFIMGTGPAIIGAIALVGSGYAFKKFVYDPHLAPIVEAAWAERHEFFRAVRNRRETNEPIAVAVPAHPPSVGTSTSVKSEDHANHLRKRTSAQRSSGSLELEEMPLLPRGVGLENGASVEVPGPSKPKRVNRRRTSADSNPFDDPPARRRSHSESDRELTPKPLIEIDDARPASAQDAEVREVIFSMPSELPSAPSHAGQSGTASPATSRPPAPSTTFSFLSLSQQSSPESMPAVIDSFSLGGAARRLDTGEGSVEGAGSGTGDALEAQSTTTLDDARSTATLDDARSATFDDDIVSLPDTTLSGSGYEDAESYSPPPLFRALTPTAAAQTASGALSPSGSGSGAGARTGLLGLARASSDDETAAGELGMSYVFPTPLAAIGISRGPQSVISISESEAEAEDGWRTDSEWEAVGSEAGGA